MTVYSPEMEHGIFIVKDKWSALSHFAGFLAAIIATPILLVKGAMVPLARPELISLAIFMTSMILLYGASASYHAFNLSYRANMVLKRIDLHSDRRLLYADSDAVLSFQMDACADLDGCCRRHLVQTVLRHLPALGIECSVHHDGMAVHFHSAGPDTESRLKAASSSAWRNLLYHRRLHLCRKEADLRP